MRRRSLLALGRSLLAATLATVGLAACIGAAPLAAEVDFVGRYRWQMDDPAFGGWSAIEVRPDGTGFIALSDRSAIVEGNFIRDGEGRITGIAPGPIQPLTYRSGRVASLDSEGLALTEDGRLYISEEGQNRVAYSDTPGRNLVFLPPVPNGQDLTRNRSFESLAVSRDGSVYTMPEVPRDTTAYPVYRFRDGAWSIPFRIRHDADWAAVGADFGPDGKFYLLERGFSQFAAFRNRIRVFDFTPRGPVEHPLLLETPYRQYGNLEGLSVWLDGEGYLRFTMISDDNFLPLGLYTDIVEYRSREPLDPAGLVQ